MLAINIEEINLIVKNQSNNGDRILVKVNKLIKLQKLAKYNNELCENWGDGWGDSYR